MSHSCTPDFLARVASAFTSLVGTPLDLWVVDGDCAHHAADVAELDLSPELLEQAMILPESLPREPDLQAEPQVCEVAGGIFRIDTPLNIPAELPAVPGVTLFVTATVRTTPQRLTTTLLRLGRERYLLAQEVAEHRTGLLPHLEQISEDFEQLTWLRRLSEQVQFRNVCDPLGDLAHSILPDLRSLIQAQSLVLVAAVVNRESLQETSPSAERPVFWAGERLLDDSTCNSLVDQLRLEMRNGGPLVLNGREVLAARRIPPFIHACMQIAVTHHGACYGWLLAFNRISKYSGTPEHEQRARQNLGDQEFGTSEASLMNSAASTLAAHARSAELFREREILLIGVIRGLISAIDAKDVYTCGHSDRVALTGRCIGEQLGLEPIECERLYMAGVLHDVGKIGIPDDVLLKPGALTDEEFAVIKRHPTIGHAILHHMPQLRQILPGVLHHHETVDGRGYPHGLKGNEIPLFGRILAVADAFDAMTSDRPYRPGMSVAKAVSVLQAGAGTQWDEQVVAAFLEVLPAVEAATRDSARHVRELLRQAGGSGPRQLEEPADAITRAVAVVHA